MGTDEGTGAAGAADLGTWPGAERASWMVTAWASVLDAWDPAAGAARLAAEASSEVAGVLAGLDLGAWQGAASEAARERVARAAQVAASAAESAEAGRQALDAQWEAARTAWWAAAAGAVS